MHCVEQARLGCGFGLEGDYLGKPGKRQLTLLSLSLWDDACREAGAELPWYSRRANLCVDGISFKDVIGKRLRIGGAILEITGESKPCGRMDELHTGLQQALRPEMSGGVSARVIRGGIIRLGDVVDILPASVPSGQ